MCVCVFLLHGAHKAESMPPISLHCDSTSTLSQGNSKVHNGKSKHIGLGHNYVSGLLNSGVITINYASSGENPKALQGMRFLKLQWGWV